MVAANTVNGANGPPIKVVGVVGMGHVIGIKKLWLTEESRDIASLLTIPAPHWSCRVFWGYFRWTMQTLFTFGLYWMGRTCIRFIYRRSLVLYDLTFSR